MLKKSYSFRYLQATECYPINNEIIMEYTHSKRSILLLNGEDARWAQDGILGHLLIRAEAHTFDDR